MSWKRRATGDPERVNAEVATWEQSICDIDNAAGASESMRKIHTAQCAGVQAAVSRFTLATPEEHVVDVVAEGHVQSDDASKLVLKIETSKRREAIERAKTVDGTEGV